MAMDDLVNNNEKFLRMIVKEIKKDCNAKETIKINKKWKKDYLKQNYKLMTREDIYHEIVRLLSSSKNKSSTRTRSKSPKKISPRKFTSMKSFHHKNALDYF